MDNTLFLDLDGVFADFDAAAGAVIGTDNTYKWEWINGGDAFWAKLNAVPNFFATFPLMDGAMELWDAVKHRGPTILTAVPSDGSRRRGVEADKRDWVSRHFGPDVHVITCLTSEKPNYCNPGDTLVDDRKVNERLWVLRGGTYVTHTSASDTIAQLRALHAI